MSLPKYIKDEYQIDTIEEVNWDLLRNNLEAANRVLDNPEKFPNAVSNMGQALPAKKEVENWLKETPSRFKPSLNGAVLFFAQQYMETDEHLEWFTEEAQMWLKTLKNKKECDACKKSSKDIFDLFNI